MNIEHSVSIFKTKEKAVLETDLSRLGIPDDFMPLIRNKSSFTVRLEDLSVVLGTCLSFKAAARIINHMNELGNVALMSKVISADKIRDCCVMYEENQPALVKRIEKEMGLADRKETGKKRRLPLSMENRLSERIRDRFVKKPDLVLEADQGKRIAGMAALVRQLLEEV